MGNEVHIIKEKNIMGSFSWIKADKYQDYGYLGTKENGEPKYDIYI